MFVFHYQSCVYHTNGGHVQSFVQQPTQQCVQHIHVYT